MADPYLRAFGQRVMGLRRIAKLTQEELAARAKLSSNYVSSVERGAANPSLTVLRKLATGLGTTLTVLIDDDRSGKTFTLGDTEWQLVAAVAGRSEMERQRVLRIVLATLEE